VLCMAHVPHVDYHYNKMMIYPQASYPLLKKRFFGAY